MSPVYIFVTVLILKKVKAKTVNLLKCVNIMTASFPAAESSIGHSTVQASKGFARECKLVKVF